MRYMKKINLIFLCSVIFILTCVPAFSETISKDMYVDPDYNIWVTVEVWRDGDDIYGKFTPSQTIPDPPGFSLWDFSIIQNDEEYGVVFKEYYEYLTREGDHVTDREITKPLGITKPEGRGVVVKPPYEIDTEFDLQDEFILKHSGTYHEYTMTIPAKNSNNSSTCFIKSLTPDK